MSSSSPQGVHSDTKSKCSAFSIYEAEWYPSPGKRGWQAPRGCAHIPSLAPLAGKPLLNLRSGAAGRWWQNGLQLQRIRSIPAACIRNNPGIREPLYFVCLRGSCFSWAQRSSKLALTEEGKNTGLSHLKGQSRLFSWAKLNYHKVISALNSVHSMAYKRP